LLAIRESTASPVVARMKSGYGLLHALATVPEKHSASVAEVRAQFRDGS
jgi:hypothetical protein